MSRRSPTNERYQKYTGPKGQTRKSAAQAKPTRKEGGGSTSTSKSKGKASASTAPGGKFYEPDTPEYRFWRRAWWISLGTGLVFVAISFYFQYYLKNAFSWSRMAGVISIGLAYAAIIAAFFIDYRKLRLMRTGKYVSKKPAKPADKPSDSTGSNEKS